MNAKIERESTHHSRYVRKKAQHILREIEEEEEKNKAWLMIHNVPLAIIV